MLITDYIFIGGIGAAFVNSGLITLAVLFMLHRYKVELIGASISSVWIVSGFALFGKNLFNIWFIILGVWIYSKYKNDSFSSYINIALLGTSLSPIITQVVLRSSIPKLLSVPLGILVGIFIGLLLPVLSPYLLKVHQGFNLYNMGFVAGLLGIVLSSLLKSYGISIEGQNVWSTGNNLILGHFLTTVFFSMIIISFSLDKDIFNKWKKILTYSGRLTKDFILLEGFAPSLLNMGLSGLLATMYVTMIGSELNGPTIGAIFTIVGFSTFGKHVMNMAPIILGVYFASLVKTWHIADPAIVLAALFGTTLAPIAGEFGWGYGIIAGFLHSSVVLNVGYFHSGINLYNNGFSGGIVAALMIPIVKALQKETNS